MKKLLSSAAILGSLVALAACSSMGGSEQDETLTQAPYAEERTVGPDDRMETVRSAEPEFDRRQVK